MKKAGNAGTRDRLATKKEEAFQEGVAEAVRNGGCEEQEGVGESGIYGERALWRAVITQALMDAGSGSLQPEMKFDRAQAISWLSVLSPDFSDVCSLAGLDVDYVRSKAKEAISRGCSWRKDELRDGRRKRLKVKNTRKHALKSRVKKSEEIQLIVDFSKAGSNLKFYD